METLTFEQSMKRLEEITNQLEKNDIPLNEAIQLFQEGLNLAQSCDVQLKQFEKVIQDVMKQHEEVEA